MKDAWMLWAAQGFGVGRLPATPGTFGSVLGLGWTLLLLAAQDWRVFAAGCVLGVAGSVWLCGEAERILGRPDPGSVVLDEVVAVPLCFAAWLALHAWTTDRMLRPGELFREGGWPVTLAIFAAFRFFDVLKPWPVRQSQTWPGGWGVTMDDLLAAVYVNVVVGPVLAWLLPRPG